jgi:thiamine pyrophosphate-dependent acetolactate synthase large subunit-like protein
MAYTTGSTFSLQTGYNLPSLFYPTSGLTSGTRSSGIVAPTDPYTSNATSSFFTDISNKTNGTLSVEQLAYIVENDPTLLTSISANVPIVYTQSTDTIGKMIVSKIIKNTTKVYGVPGASWFDVDDYLADASASLEYVHASNESAAVYMASYFAEMKNSVGVTFCTSGPGTTMATTAVNSIYNETKSCVCFFGMSSSNFQSGDMAIMEAITQKCIYIYKDTLNPDQLVDEAFRIAKQGFKFKNAGPVAVFVHQTAWRLPYYTTDAKISFNVPVNPVDNFLNTIFSNINQDSKIIIRVGERVDKNNITRLASLTNTYKNIYVHLITNSKMYIDDIDTFSNVAIEGPITNKIVNQNYETATLVIQIGTGIEYTKTTFADVKILMKTANSQIFYALDQELVYFPASSTKNNTLMTDVSLFSEKFVDMLYTKSQSFFNTNTIWSDTKSQQNSYITNLIELYKSQLPTPPQSPYLTTISILANILDVIYNLQQDPSKKMIRDNNLYSFDVGLASFLGDSIMYHSKINHILNFNEFGPIGCSLACIAGRIDSGFYSGDIVCFIGDGGFLNVPGDMIDLRRALMTKSKRCLFVLLNDKHYSAVSSVEDHDLHRVTLITSTATMQVGDDYLYNLTCAFMGGVGNIKQSINYTNITSGSNLLNLRDFVTKWYRKDPNYNLPGFYFINYKTDGLPRTEIPI